MNTKKIQNTFQSLLKSLKLGIQASTLAFVPLYGQETKYPAPHWHLDRQQEPEYQYRCKHDWQEPTQAQQRVRWWVRCYPNEVRSFLMYENQEETSMEDLLSDAEVFFLKTRKGKYSRIARYPTFRYGYVGPWWTAPSDVNAPCNKPDNVFPVAFCTASCYHPQTQVEFEGGPKAIYDAFLEKTKNIVVLAKGSFLNHIEFALKPVKTYTTELTDSHMTLLELKTQSQGRLVVTENHPLVNGDGYMKEAQNLRVGDSLIRSSGVKDKITQITPIPYFGKVYNVKPDVKSVQEQVVVAEDFLSGSSWYQNEGFDFINRKVLRFHVAKTFAVAK